MQVQEVAVSKMLGSLLVSRWYVGKVALNHDVISQPLLHETIDMLHIQKLDV